VTVAATVFLATLGVAILEGPVGIPNASTLYLVAVVVSAMVAGTGAALGTAVLSVLAYDLLFTAPTMTLHITDTGEWLSLVLLSFVGITVGQLVAILRRRAEEAHEREQESQDLFAISRVLATRDSTEAALGSIAPILRQRTGLERVWFGLGPMLAQERVVADTGTGSLPTSTSIAQLRRAAEGSPGEWVILHAPAQLRREASTGLRHRVVIETADGAVGSIWGVRERSAPEVDRSAGRLLAAAADQIGQALHQDRLAGQAHQVRIAQEGDALKSALVESVSHDLRIPLASIRAAAGPLIDPAARLSPTQVREAGSAIDREARRLDRLVAGLLDLGRIQSGSLQASREAVELREVLSRATARLVDRLPDDVDAASIEVDLEETWVDADPLLLQQAIGNVIENAVRHTPRGTRVLVHTTRSTDPPTIRLTVEDAGPGVPPEALPRLFDRFFRLVPPGTKRRPGSGIGLSVARGFAEAMGGTISARQSELGGLAIDLFLPATVMPAHLALED
jgi:two-component system sensor histidine kinase KdpD